MKLVPFNREVVKKLSKEGFTHIEIKPAISKENSWLNDEKDLQVLKALDRIDTMPSNAAYVPIKSEVIEGLLSNKAINCFIIVPMALEIVR
jgi:hypothetical protein